jgi:hypothetical protein
MLHNRSHVSLSELGINSPVESVLPNKEFQQMAH